MQNKKIGLALSGGIDSYVAGRILKEKGYDVFGIYMRHLDRAEGLEKAKEGAKKLGIKLFVLDLRKEFKEKVIDYFCREHQKGRNPNPCVVCNKEIKFGLLLDFALKKGACCLATGHYAEIVKRKGRYFIKKTRNQKKDQGYAMAMLSQKQLARLCFPLASLTKEEVRKTAEKEGFLPEKETSDLCFLKEKGKEEFLEEKIGKKKCEIYVKGKKIGERENCFVSRGQRKRIGINKERKYYVKEIKKGKIVLGERKELMNKMFEIKNLNWFPAEIKKKERIKVVVRDKQKGVYGWLLDKKKVVLDKKIFGISEGQLAVFYRRNLVLGGAWIKKILD